MCLIVVSMRVPLERLEGILSVNNPGNTEIIGKEFKSDPHKQLSQIPRL